MPAGGFRRRRGRAGPPGVRFASRYPVVLLVPLAGTCLGISYAYAAGLAGSWSYVGGARVAAVAAGAGLGIALAIGAVIGHRRGMSGWLILPPVVLIVGFVTTVQQVAPAVGAPGKVTTGFEAAEFALCSVLWCLSAFAFLGMLPRLWRARMAFSAKGRVLHITRARHWREASAAPIPHDEWLGFAQSRDDLAACDPRELRAVDGSLSSPRGRGQPGDGKAGRRPAVRERQVRAIRALIATRPDLIARDPSLAQVLPPGLQIKTFAYERGDGSRMYLTWFNAEVVISGAGPDFEGDVGRMRPIAWALAARLMDDEGTVYE